MHFDNNFESRLLGNGLYCRYDVILTIRSHMDLSYIDPPLRVFNCFAKYQKHSSSIINILVLREPRSGIKGRYNAAAIARVPLRCYIAG